MLYMHYLIESSQLFYEVGIISLHFLDIEV